MRLDSNGAVISSFNVSGVSNLGQDYIIFWDMDGLPIHIHKAVVDALHHAIHYNTNTIQL